MLFWFQMEAFLAPLPYTFPQVYTNTDATPLNAYSLQLTSHAHFYVIVIVSPVPVYPSANASAALTIYIYIYIYVCIYIYIYRGHYSVLDLRTRITHPRRHTTSSRSRSPGRDRSPKFVNTCACCLGLAYEHMLAEHP